MGWVIIIAAQAARRRLRHAIGRIAAADLQHISGQRGGLAMLRPERVASHRRCPHAATNELFTDIEGSVIMFPRLRLTALR